MPKFLYTVIFGAVVSLGIFILYISNNPPEGVITFLIATALFIITSSLILSVVIFGARKRLVKKDVNTINPDLNNQKLRDLYRTCLKHSTYISMVLAILLLVKGFVLK